jgi:hypothetical protein
VNLASKDIIKLELFIERKIDCRVTTSEILFLQENRHQILEKLDRIEKLKIEDLEEHLK